MNFPLLSKIFSKSEAEHVLKIFLKYPKNRASCSYKLGSYKKKRVYGIIYSSTKVDSVTKEQKGQNQIKGANETREKK